MAILQSCCFWRSVRSGSYASAIYTAAYFGVIVAIMTAFVDEERRSYEGAEATNKSSAPRLTQSFLEPEGISVVSMCFSVVMLGCACCGFICSLLLCCGLHTDNRLLLLPWILVVVVTSAVDLSHILYLMVLESMSFNPLTSIVFTVDFFLLSINVYCLLCVVSQYQEYKAGRGTALHQDSSAGGRLPVIRYEVPHTATSSRRTTLPSSGAAVGGGVSILGPVVPADTEEEEEEEGRRRRTAAAAAKRRVQFPEEGEEAAVVGEGGGEEEVGGGKWPGASGQSATLLLSSSSMAAAAALVVDTAPLLSPRPPPTDASKMAAAFFGP